MGMLQGRWSSRPTGQGKEMKPSAVLVGMVARWMALLWATILFIIIWENMAFFQSHSVVPCQRNKSGIVLCTPWRKGRFFPWEEQLFPPGATLIFLGQWKKKKGWFLTFHSQEPSFFTILFSTCDKEQYCGSARTILLPAFSMSPSKLQFHIWSLELPFSLQPTYVHISTQKMDAEWFSKTVLSACKSTWCQNPANEIFILI